MHTATTAAFRLFLAHRKTRSSADLAAYRTAHKALTVEQSRELRAVLDRRFALLTELEALEAQASL